MKDKPNSIRTYDEDGFRKRAACLCVRNELEDEVGISSSFYPADYSIDTSISHSTGSRFDYCAADLIAKLVCRLTDSPIPSSISHSLYPLPRRYFWSRQAEIETGG